jgi:hypothetical protein
MAAWYSIVIVRVGTAYGALGSFEDVVTPSVTSETVSHDKGKVAGRAECTFQTRREGNRAGEEDC